MITLTTLSELFENGLNAILGNSEIQFKIWSEAGNFKYPRREGNTVITYINGNLRTSTSANDANDLVMGVNGLSLDFMIPVTQPRTNPSQTSEELAMIKDGQFPFVQLIVNVINSYFQTAQSVTLTDADGKEFSVSFRAGTSVTGTIDLVPVLGNCMGVSLFIEVFFIEGGVSSKEVKISVDDMVIPYQALRLGRSPMTENEVYSGNLITKNVITSTAFAIDVDFPVTVSGAAPDFVKYLFEGKPNMARFVNVTWGSGKETLYFMTINTIQASAEGITNVGASASLMEVTDNLFTVPDGYQVRKFLFDSSEATDLRFSLSEDCNVFIAGKALKTKSGIYTFVDLDTTDFVYDAEEGTYAVYLITGKAVNVLNANAAYKGVYNIIGVSGVWKWNDNLTYRIGNLTSAVNYSSNGKDYHSVSFFISPPGSPMPMRYLVTTSGVGTADDNVCETARLTNVTTWVDDAYKTIDFGVAEQNIGQTFYDYLLQNAKKVTNG